MIEKIKTGLTASQIKWIAVFFMTVDHSHMLCAAIPMLLRFVPILRLLGRAAAPLFLFLITESAWHTRSKIRFLVRLYFAGVGTGIFTIVTNMLFGHIMIYTPGNIFFTFFYTVTYIYLFEYMLIGIRRRDWKLILKSIIIAGFTLLPQVLFYLINRWKFPGMERDTVVFWRELITTIFPPILHVEYSILFVLMGIGIYFCKSIKQKCFVFILFCGVSFIGALSGGELHLVNEFMINGQYWMILALPFMCSYNGDRGKHRKLVFYIYYPVHRYLFALAGGLLQGI